MQNWDSGIDLTVLHCTFFRNFCSFAVASLAVTNVWPLVANIIANAFIHNDAVLTTGDYFYWDPPVRLSPSH